MGYIGIGALQAIVKFHPDCSLRENLELSRPEFGVDGLSTNRQTIGLSIFILSVNLRYSDRGHPEYVSNPTVYY